MNIIWTALTFFVATSAFAEINQINYNCAISVNDGARSSSTVIALKKISRNDDDSSFRGVGMTATGEIIIVSRAEFHTDVNGVFHKEAYQTQTDVNVVGSQLRTKSIRDLKRKESILADFLPELSVQVNCQYVSEQ